jgi:putative transposase
MVRESIAIYNGERPHLSLQLKTPDEVHRASLATSGLNRKTVNQMST